MDVLEFLKALLQFAVTTGVVFAIYFAPSIAAYRRGHLNFRAIAITNALLGWTGIGWIVSLIWANTNTNDRANRS
ncbi:ABC-type Mn2+/Zn2+ transport systems, permease component [Burkholderia pseudomallei]|nr:ABC-type Mn2+/Zn2+ transport systems, permease component [Burkholderia pseudomallei]CAJ4274856.1 ABC-type Mn2+/Zn2+ transport systems, permease component [Burkholderia pseudomallei]